MKTLLKILSFLGLCFTFIPSVFVLNGTISMQNHKNLMLIGVILWFLTAPIWMKSKSLEEEKSE
ncbi:hypothetical protein ACFLTE_02255 [Bacteroidota bacterium]